LENTTNGNYDEVKNAKTLEKRQEQLKKKIPVTKQDMRTYTNFWKDVNENMYEEFKYFKALPAIIFQKAFDLAKYPEVKLNVVFGKVMNFKTHYHNWRRQQIVDVGNGTLTCGDGCSADICKDLLLLMDWDTVIPRIEQYAYKLHSEFVRVDIFPISETDFFINEAEITSGGAPIEIFNKNVLKKLEKMNKEIINAEDDSKYFLPDGQEKNDFMCDIEAYPLWDWQSETN